MLQEQFLGSATLEKLSLADQDVGIDREPITDPTPAYHGYCEDLRECLRKNALGIRKFKRLTLGHALLGGPSAYRQRYAGRSFLRKGALKILHDVNPDDTLVP